jgi:transcription antitermination factor NusG
MSSEKTWHVIYTRPRSEKKVAQNLARRNIESYCAVNKSVHQWADRKKTIYQPLFDNYVFVHIYESEQKIVKQTDGVLNFVYWLGQPAVVKIEEIEAMQNFLQEHEDVRLEKVNVSTTEQVRVVEEPLVYQDGSGLDPKHQALKLTIPSLGCAMVAEVRKSNVEIIQQYKPAVSKIA